VSKRKVKEPPPDWPKIGNKKGGNIVTAKFNITAIGLNSLNRS